MSRGSSALRYYEALAGHPRKRLDYPSTGLHAILFASSLCRRVELFGFSFHRGRRTGGAGLCRNVYHYYDRLGWRNLLAAHNLTAEMRVARALKSLGKICIR